MSTSNEVLLEKTAAFSKACRELIECGMVTAETDVMTSDQLNEYTDGVCTHLAQKIWKEFFQIVHNSDAEFPENSRVKHLFELHLKSALYLYTQQQVPAYEQVGVDI